MFQSSIVTNDTALEAFKELSKKVEYEDGTFVGADFFNEIETLEGLDDQKKYLIARSKVEVVDGSINRKYYLEHYPFQSTLHTEATDIPLTKNELTMSEVTGEVIIVMKKTGVDSHKYPANVPALFSIKDSKDAVANGKLAVMVDGELRAEFAKNSDDNYLGLVTYGHPGQLDNYTLSNIPASDSQATISLRNGSSSIRDLWDVWGNSFQPSSNLSYHSVALTFNLKGTGVSNIMSLDKTMMIHATGSDLDNPTLDVDPPTRTLRTDLFEGDSAESGQVNYYTERIDPTNLSIDDIEENVVLDLANALNVECKQANLTTGDAFTVSGNTITCTLNPSVLSLSYTSTSYTTNITYKITINDMVNNTLKVNYVNPNALGSNSNTEPFSGQVDFRQYGGINTNATMYRNVINSVFTGLVGGLGLDGLNEIGFIAIKDDNTLYITLDYNVIRVPVWFEGTGITITTLYGNKDNKLGQIPPITDPFNFDEAFGIFNQWGPKTLGAFSLRTDEEKLKMTFQFNSEDKEWPHSKITLESKGFESYFHALVDNYYALKAEGALYRNDQGTITPLELTLQALTEFNYITLSMNGFTDFGFNVVSEDLETLSNTDESKGLSNILFQDLDGNTLGLEELSNNYTIYIKSYDFPTSGTNWTKYSSKIVLPNGTVISSGGWQNKTFPLPNAFRPMRIYILKNAESAKDLRICFNGQTITKNEIIFKKGFNDFSIPVSQSKKLNENLLDNAYNENLVNDYIKLTDSDGNMSWTKYSSKIVLPNGTVISEGGWQNMSLAASVNNYSRYYRNNDESVALSFNL